MNGSAIFQLSTLAIYAILIVVVLRNGQTRLKKYFMVYLIASAGWSLTSFMGNSDLPSEQVLLWAKSVALFASWAVVAYSHFITAFVHRNIYKVAILGYGYLFAVAVLTIVGRIHQGFIPLVDGSLQKSYGNWLYFLILGGAFFVGISAFLLVKSYRVSKDVEHRNRITYLLAGIAFLVVFGAVWEAILGRNYSIGHVGHMGNAFLITYAIFRYKLLDIKLVIRKGMVYSGITVFITATYLSTAFGLQYLLKTWSAFTSVVVTIGLIIVMAFLFNPFKEALEKVANRIFYGKTYDYRQMVLSFADRMSNVLDLEELADAMLPPITNAVRASQVSLLFAENGHFKARYAERLVETDSVIPLDLRKDGPLVTWLDRENKPLSLDTINTAPEFKGMWQEEKDNIDAAQIDLLCPLKSKKKLVAILALSKKYPRGFYSTDDKDMLMTLAHEAAVVIENAELYSRAKQRANTDELTNLFNHRYFHQRLDEEISRSSRFGKIFTLIFLDMDYFKTYNDVSGHLAGDEILKHIGRHIKESVRDIDICFRYGGDEFAIIVPETTLDDGGKIAERIRKGIESQMDLQGMPLTCSIGIASWPTDGVMHEEIIQSSDAAIYYAKRTGRNRICLACEVALSEVLKRETGLKPKSSETILSTVYALAATVDAKDHYTYGHSKKVSKYATDIAEAIGYSREGIEIIRAAALLHDIGKIGISDRVLKKSEALNPEEWELICNHPTLGVSIIKHIDSLKGSLAAVQYHHEHYDGNGYPAGLKGNNIPLDARLMAVADAYDAMTSQRPYRQKKTNIQALEELKKCAGKQFDPEIVTVFIDLQTQVNLTTKLKRSKDEPVISDITSISK